MKHFITRSLSVVVIVGALLGSAFALSGCTTVCKIPVVSGVIPCPSPSPAASAVTH